MSSLTVLRASLGRLRQTGLGLLLVCQATLSWAGTPLVIAVDVGHSIDAPGATSARGVPEYAFNQGFAEHLVAALEQHPGFTPLLVNADGRIPSLDARVEAAQAGGADVFVSIHHDAVQPQYLGQWNFAGETLAYSDTFQGYSVFYSGTMSDPRPSALLARDLGASLAEAGFIPTAHHAEVIEGENRPLIVPEHGVYQYDQLRVLRTNRLPAVLVEVGVIVHREEELAVQTQAYRDRFAEGLIQGLLAFSQR